MSWCLPGVCVGACSPPRQHCWLADPGRVWLGSRRVPLCTAAMGRRDGTKLVQVSRQGHGELCQLCKNHVTMRRKSKRHKAYLWKHPCTSSTLQSRNHSCETQTATQVPLDRAMDPCHPLLRTQRHRVAVCNWVVDELSWSSALLASFYRCPDQKWPAAFLFPDSRC